MRLWRQASISLRSTCTIRPTRRSAFAVKIAVALPGLKPGPVSKFYDAKLGPDEALEIDCPDIFKLAETKPIS